MTEAHPLMARELWEWLGFSYASIDIDGSPGAIPLDLNYDDAPAAMRGKFNIVTNYGTTEHICNQLNAFKVIHDLCAPDGIMIHNLPAQGMMNHGLVNYNPKFFWMLARSNGYKWLHADLWISTISSPLPGDVVQNMSSFPTAFAGRADSFRINDGSIQIALRKQLDLSFVAPLDAPEGAAVNGDVASRYWTVFDRERFNRIIEQGITKRMRITALARRALSKLRWLLR